MNKIKLLDPVTINQIAAGEVIENPSSVVKELVENAIDSKASFIEIETTGGGQDSIVVRDNGIGMSAEEIEVAPLRHTTSKLRQFEDLYSLNSLGFRGEALASIVSIARVLITSSTEENGLGSSLLIEGGEYKKKGHCSRTRGTTIEVRSLFYNVPARRKFQKSSRSDISAIRKVLVSMILSSPSIGWSWINEGQRDLFFDRDSSLDERIEFFFGKDFMTRSLQVSYKEDDKEIEGRLDLPLERRTTQQGIRLFVNNRSIYSSQITKMVLDVYSSLLPSQGFPSFILYLNLPQTLCDVNVHPQKKEILIREEAVLSRFIQASITPIFQRLGVPSLYQPIIIQETDGNEDICSKTSDKSNYSSPSLFLHKEKFKEEIKYSLEEEVLFPIEETSVKETMFLFKNKPVILNRIGIFIFVSDNEFLYVINLVLARAHVIFVVSQNRDKLQFNKQSLLVPFHFETTYEEQRKLLSSLNLFSSLGFSIKFFRDNYFILDGLSPLIPEKEAIEWIKEILVMLDNTNEKVPLDRILLRFFAKKMRKRSGETLNASLIVNYLWELGVPERAYDGGPLCKRILEEDIIKWYRKGF